MQTSQSEPQLILPAIHSRHTGQASGLLSSKSQARMARVQSPKRSTRGPSATGPPLLGPSLRVIAELRAGHCLLTQDLEQLKENFRRAWAFSKEQPDSAFAKEFRAQQQQKDILDVREEAVEAWCLFYKQQFGMLFSNQRQLNAAVPPAPRLGNARKQTYARSPSMPTLSARRSTQVDVLVARAQPTLAPPIRKISARRSPYDAPRPLKQVSPFNSEGADAIPSRSGESTYFEPAEDDLATAREQARRLEVVRDAALKGRVAAAAARNSAVAATDAALEAAQLAILHASMLSNYRMG